MGFSSLMEFYNYYTSLKSTPQYILYLVQLATIFQYNISVSGENETFVRYLNENFEN